MRNELTGLEETNRFCEMVFLLPSPTGITRDWHLVREQAAPLCPTAGTEPGTDLQPHLAPSRPSPEAPGACHPLGCDPGSGTCSGSKARALPGQRTPRGHAQPSSCGKADLKEEARPSSHPPWSALIPSSSPTLSSGVSSSHPQPRNN